MQTKISLITTLFNEADGISAFLESYKSQSKIADEFIIVDGGSTDGTAEIITEFAQNNPKLNINLIIDKKCSKKYSKSPIAKGRNLAITVASHDIIAVTDAGCFLDKNWLEEITKPFENPEIDVVSGWYKIITKNDAQKIYAENYIPKLENVNPKTFLPSSRSLAFKKHCWEKVGGYPEFTYTAEDTLFDIYLKKHKFNFIFNPSATVSWEIPKTAKDLKKQLYNYRFGDGANRLFLNKYKRFIFKFPVILINYLYYKYIKPNYEKAVLNQFKLAEIKSYIAGFFYGIYFGINSKI